MRVKTKSFSSKRFFIMAHNTEPAMSVVKVCLQLRWFQICVQENYFTEHALRLLQILSFFDAVKQNHRSHLSVSFSLTWWRDVSEIRKASIIISTHNYIERTYTSLQISKTLTRTTFHSNLKDKAYYSFPLLWDRFTSDSELFTENHEMQNPFVYTLRLS